MSANEYDNMNMNLLSESKCWKADSMPHRVSRSWMQAMRVAICPGLRLSSGLAAFEAMEAKDEVWSRGRSLTPRLMRTSGCLSRSLNISEMNHGLSIPLILLNNSP